MSIIKEINQAGQSLWYDNIERRLLRDGSLAGMIERGEIRGITSNPSIFNKAISQSSDYDQDIEILSGQGLTREQAYEKLAVQDIQDAADLFVPLYEMSKGGDGYVSLEVNPYLAHDTAKTVAEAIKLWKLVDRPNLMVKIPATLEGLPAISQVIAEGINVNVTLIFGLNRYQKVMDAYLTGLEERSARSDSLVGIASVASFFISRIDTKIDRKLGEMLDGVSSEKHGEIQQLLGKAALASGKLAYELFQDNFSGGADRFGKLAALGARPQRALWASTSTKNPAYPDTIYVDGLVGPGTVNTVPPHTLQAFFDHGKTDLTLKLNLEGSHKVFEDLAQMGIDMNQVAHELEQEGVKAFSDAYTSLLDSLEIRMEDFRKS